MKKPWMMLALAVIVVAGALSREWLGQPPIDTAVGQKLLPNLHSQLDQINRVEILTGDHKLQVVLAHAPKGWTVVNADQYPANFHMIQKLVTGLAKTQLVEPKTKLSQHYPTLGVEDLGPDAQHATLVRLIADKSPVAEVLIGLNPELRSGHYVRLSGHQQSWLVDQAFTVPSWPGGWLAQPLVDWPADQLNRVILRPAQGKPLVLERQPDQIRLQPTLPESWSVTDPGALAARSQLLNRLNIEAVAPWRTEHDREGWQPLKSAEFVAKSGLQLTVTPLKGAEPNWVHIDLNVPDDLQPSMRETAKTLHQRLDGRRFKVSGRVYQQLQSGVSDVAGPPDPKTTTNQQSASPQ